MGHVTLAAIAGTVILVPYVKVKPLHITSSSGAEFQIN